MECGLTDYAILKKNGRFPEGLHYIKAERT